uniref:RNase H type-1 domain-containing protein n=1 Tax=Setaria italica TaxID=4555 RepID=K3ZDE6_SETIT
MAIQYPVYVKGNSPLEELSTCDVCGMEAEDEHHAVVRCNMASTLGAAMRELLLVLWRAWFNRNEITHGGKGASIVGSVKFLTCYRVELCIIRQQVQDDHKGKKQMFQEPPAGKREASHSKSTAQWKPPDPGWFKINVDGAFSERSGAGGVGVVIRDHLGAVKLAAWRVIFGASNAEEVEARACKEGADLAAEWIRAPVILESDRAMVIQYLKEENMKPACFATIQETRSAAQSRLPCCVLSHVKLMSLRRWQSG